MRIIKCSKCNSPLTVRTLTTYFKSINMVCICEKCGNEEELSLEFKFN